MKEAVKLGSLSASLPPSQSRNQPVHLGSHWRSWRPCHVQGPFLRHFSSLFISLPPLLPSLIFRFSSGHSREALLLRQARRNLVSYYARNWWIPNYFCWVRLLSSFAFFLSFFLLSSSLFFQLALPLWESPGFLDKEREHMSLSMPVPLPFALVFFYLARVLVLLFGIPSPSCPFFHILVVILPVFSWCGVGCPLRPLACPCVSVRFDVFSHLPFVTLLSIFVKSS